MNSLRATADSFAVSSFLVAQVVVKIQTSMVIRDGSLRCPSRAVGGGSAQPRRISGLGRTPADEILRDSATMESISAAAPTVSSLADREATTSSCSP